MPVGFESHNEFEQEATRLKQLYDLTVALYGQEHERVAEALKDADPFETKHTEIGEIAHNLNQLYEYTKSRYPNRLRQLLLISLVTLLEGYLTDLVEEIFHRDLSPFKTQGKLDIPKGKLLSTKSIEEIHELVLSRERRRITSGGISDTSDYYESRFSVNFNNLSVNLNQIKEIHQRRHLHVHNNGICDGRYARKFNNEYSPGDKVQVGHEYFLESVEVVREFASEVADECLQRFPQSTRKKSVTEGIKEGVGNDEQVLLIRLEVAGSRFEGEEGILDIEIEMGNGEDFRMGQVTYQIIHEEGRCILIIGGTRKKVGRAVKAVKMEDGLTFRMATDLLFAGNANP